MPRRPRSTPGWPMRSVNRWLCRALPLALVSCLAVPAGAAVPVDRQDVRAEFVLPNGLRVVVLEAPGSPLVASLAIVRAGSRDEDAGLAGVSHLLEHLLFDGTATRSREAFFREVYGLGAYLNGFTRKDLTGYIFMGQPDHLGRLLDLQADLLFHPAFDPAKFPATVEVVKEELRSALARPERGEEVRQAARAFEGTPYAAPVLGSEASLGALSRDAVLAYYRRHYAPDNITLLVAGPVTAGQVEPLVAARFGAAVPAGGPASPAAAAPAFPEPRLFTDRTAAPRKALALSVVLPNDARLYAALCHLPLILEARLTRRREELGLPSALHFGAGLAVRRDLTELELTATFPREVAEGRVFDLVRGEVDRLAAGEIAEEDFASAHRGLLLEEASLRERTHYWLMERAGEALAFGPAFLPAVPARLAAATLEDARAAGRQALAVPFTASLFLPDGGGAAAGPAPRRAAVRQVLPNGTVALAREAPGSFLVAVHVLVRDRARREPAGKAGIAEVLHRLLPRGTRRLDAIALQRRLDTLGARLAVAPDPQVPFGDAYASRRFTYLRLEVLAPQAREAVALLAELVDAPRLDAADLADVKKELEAILARRAQQADRLAEERLEARLLAGTPMASPLYGTPETLAAISVEDVREFHRRYFAPGNLVVSAVGGLPGDDLLALLHETFGARAPAPLPPLPPVPFSLAPGAEPGAAPRAGRGQAGLAWGRLVSVAGPRRGLALELAAGILSARLFGELREKEGLAYSVGAFVEPLGEAALVSVRMATGPDKVAQARAGVAREMAALDREAVAPDEIERRANALAGRWAMRLLSSINQAYALGVAEFAGLPHAFGEDYRALLRGLTPEEVAEAIRAAFQPAPGVWAEAE